MAAVRLSTESGSDTDSIDSILSMDGFPNTCLTFKDLAFTAKLPKGESKTVLEPCSGHFESGELVAIMGPSGCGKTTLLDMLAMKKTGTYSGQVCVNGHKRHPVLFPRIAAYVGQEDQMPAHWKVREALEFNSALKCPPGDAGISRKVTASLIHNLLEVFGLTGVADTYIGGEKVRGISGGQRRRVTLARGVAAQAPLLFCDEPTSGLSSTDASLCVKALRGIAKKMNVLILVVIHQPRREIVELFDKLVLLTSSPGRMAYFGSMAGAPLYMESCGHPVPCNSNPADVYLDLLTPGTDEDDSDALVAAFAEKQKPGLDIVVDAALGAKGLTAKELLIAAHHMNLKDSSEEGSDSKFKVRPYAVSFGTQLGVLLTRRARVTMRNPGAMGMQLGMPTAMGILWGLLFQGICRKEFGTPQLLFIFMMLIMLSLQSLPMMSLFIDERAIMKRETSERLYSTGAHILSSFAIVVPVSLLGAMIQTLIILGFAGLQVDYLPTVLGWTLLLFLLFDSLYSCVAAAAPDGNQAMIIATPFLILCILFSGLIITKATAPVYLLWIFEVSPMRYAMQAIMVELAGPAPTAEGQGVLHSLNYVAGEDMKGVAVIACMIILLRVLQVVFMKFLNNLQK